MSVSLTLGRPFGIRLVVHASWLIMFALVTWSVSTLLGDYGRPLALALAGIYACGLFAGIVAHEFGHALTARRFGVRTESITLFIFGGVAAIETDPPTPGAEIAIAAAGPAVSVVLAGLCALAAQLTNGPAGDLFTLLALGNGAVAVFNLVPAFPMDGGRILRALIWLARHNRLDATRLAAGISITLAVALACAGIVFAVRTGEWQLAWGALVAAFVIRAARRGVTEARLAGGIA
jgi:Zn-dependent protease